MLNKELFVNVADSFSDKNYVVVVAKDKSIIKWLILIAYMQPTIKDYEDILEQIINVIN